MAGGRNLAAHARGRFGEQEAARWYVRHGYVVLDRNWRCARGELDLVVARSGELVIVEVKARRNLDFGGPLEAISAQKRVRLRQLAAAWLDHNRGSAVRAAGTQFELRLDLVAVTGVRLEVLEGVL